MLLSQPGETSDGVSKSVHRVFASMLGENEEEEEEDEEEEEEEGENMADPAPPAAPPPAASLPGRAGRRPIGGRRGALLPDWPRCLRRERRLLAARGGRSRGGALFAPPRVAMGTLGDHVEAGQ